MKYFDAHAHIQFPQFDADREAVIEAMRAQEVGALLVGCDFPSSQKAVELAEQHEDFYASVGLHPNHEADEWFEEKKYLELAQSTKVVAIGECGLDYYRPTDITPELKQKQKNLFDDHIKLAATTGKPLMIHARPSKGTTDAYADALDMLEAAKQEHPELSGDFHFFVGDEATAERIITLGFTISYTAVITFARDYDDVIRSAPLASLLSETDCPYVAPASRRGQRNDPLAVIEVVEAIARIRRQDTELVRRAMLQNAERVFGILSHK